MFNKSLCHAVPCCATGSSRLHVQQISVPCCAMLCHAVPCCAMLGADAGGAAGEAAAGTRQLRGRQKGTHLPNTHSSRVSYLFFTKNGGLSMWQTKTSHTSGDPAWVQRPPAMVHRPGTAQATCRHAHTWHACMHACVHAHMHIRRVPPVHGVGWGFGGSLCSCCQPRDSPIMLLASPNISPPCSFQSFALGRYFSSEPPVQSVHCI
jgi:hypothetical protein